MPGTKDGPRELNAMLERIYRKKIEEGASKTDANRMAWDAVRKAGWKRSPRKWIKDKP